MEPTELISYRRSLRRKNYSSHTVKNYMNILKHFIGRLAVPLSQVTHREVGAYVDYLLTRRRKPKTITCHLQTIRLFFDYLIEEEGMKINNPVIRVSIRLPKPLPRHLHDDQIAKFFKVITDGKKRADIQSFWSYRHNIADIPGLVLTNLQHTSPKATRFVINN
jgi:site-specific recombinase XerD